MKILRSVAAVTASLLLTSLAAQAQPAPAGSGAKTGQSGPASQAAGKPASGPTQPADAGKGQPQPGPGPSKEDLQKAFQLHTEGGKFLEKKEYRKAVVKLGEALKINPNLSGAWFDLSLAYTYAGEYKFAEYCIAKVKKLGQDASFLESQLAKARPPDRKLPPPAVSKGLEPGNVFGIVVPMTPPSKAAQALAVQYQTAGGKLLDAKQYKEAIDQYKQALTLNPGLSGGWYDLSLAYTYSQRFDLAKAAIEEIRKLHGDLAFPQAELDKAMSAYPQAAEQKIQAPPR